MKDTLAVFLSFLLSSILISCGPTQEEAVKYNDDIIKEQKLIAEKLDVLLASYEDYIPEEMDAAYESVLNQINASIDKVSKMEEFDKSDEFRQKALELFKTYKSVIENEHVEMVRIYKIPQEEFTDEHRIKWDELFKASENKIDKAINDFIKVQQKFAKKYNLEIDNTANEDNM